MRSAAARPAGCSRAVLDITPGALSPRIRRCAPPPEALPPAQPGLPTRVGLQHHVDAVPLRCITPGVHVLPQPGVGRHAGQLQPQDVGHICGAQDLRQPGCAQQGGSSKGGRTSKSLRPRMPGRLRGPRMCVRNARGL